MEFFLPFAIKPLVHKITYKYKLLMMGSCFSTEIGARLEQLKFDILQNPTGIIYHPLVISEVLIRIVKNHLFTPEDLFEETGIYHSWHHHSSFSGTNKDAVLENMNREIQKAHTFLKEAQFLFITPATSYGYFLKKNGKIVANCHKMPASIFEKKLVFAKEIKTSLSNALTEVRKFNNNIQIIFTISPVRHLRDGVVENNRSKAEVISAVHAIIDEGLGSYFPSYELVNDVLRDYRFFKEDFAHPNASAISFVLEKFIEYAIDAESIKILYRVEEIFESMHHQPKFPGTDEHIRFARQQLKKVEELKEEYPFLNLDSATGYFQQIIQHDS